MNLPIIQRVYNGQFRGHTSKNGVRTILKSYDSKIETRNSNWKDYKECIQEVLDHQLSSLSNSSTSKFISFSSTSECF